jgi:hypothetical protein
MADDLDDSDWETDLWGDEIIEDSNIVAWPTDRRKPKSRDEERAKKLLQHHYLTFNVIANKGTKNPIVEIIRKKGEIKLGLIQCDKNLWKVKPAMGIDFSFQELDEILEYIEEEI